MVTGAMRMPSRGIGFSRNMTIIRDEESLTLVNSVRLGTDGLRQLERLGKVDSVIRLAGFHGMDDAFYKKRYGAEVYAVAGQKYVSGFDFDAEESFQADHYADASTELPVAGSRLFVLETATVPEALLVMLRHGGTVVAGDLLQNWQTTDSHFTLIGRLMMRLGGFIKPYNVGPAWLKFCKPSAEELRSIFDLRFENLIPAHGEPVIGNAKESYRPAIEAAARKVES